MKFPYQEYPRDPSPAFPNLKTRLVPIIPVSIIAASRAIAIDALVDSGSDNCVFPGMLGVALGIDVQKGPVQKISGLGGRVVEAHFHNVKLRVGDVECSVYAGFSFDTLGISSLLGQRGFFDNFKIAFDRSARCIIVTKRTLAQKFLTQIGL